MTTYIFGLILLVGCANAPKVNSQSQGSDLDSSPQLPKVGYNTKASLKIQEQTAYAEGLFARMDSSLLRGLIIRVPGGTRSQKEDLEDWTADQILYWTGLQQKYGFSMVYVVNGNDSPQNQLKLIRRWQEHGAQFDFLEMLSEVYLPKFSKPKLEKPEVTRMIDEKIYTQEILPAYFPYLDSLDLPYFLVCAPYKTDRMGRERYAYWNSHMAEYFKEHGEKRKLGATIHLYQKVVAEGFDYDQIDRLRAQLPEGTPIAITEMGVLDQSLEGEEFINACVAHLSAITERLKPGDSVFNQVLYHDYRNGNQMANLHPDFNGITPKGEAVLNYYQSLFD
jgi:hypothetical protein